MVKIKGTIEGTSMVMLILELHDNNNSLVDANGHNKKKSCGDAKIINNTYFKNTNTKLTGLKTFRINRDRGWCMPTATDVGKIRPLLVLRLSRINSPGQTLSLNCVIYQICHYSLFNYGPVRMKFFCLIEKNENEKSSKVWRTSWPQEVLYVGL